MKSVNALIVLSLVACIALQTAAQKQTPPNFKRPSPPLTFTHRFRREEPRGSIDVNARHKERNGPAGRQAGQQVRVDANYNIWKSRNGNARLDANAYHERNWGAFPGPRRDTGGMITFTGRIPG